MAIKFQLISIINDQSFLWCVCVCVHVADQISFTRPSALQGKTAHLESCHCWIRSVDGKRLRNAPKRACPSPPDLDKKNFGENFHQNLLEIDWNLRDFSKFLNHALSTQTVPQCATPGCIQFRHLGLGSSLRNNIPTGSPCSQRLGSPTAECRLHTIHSAKETQRTTSLWKTRKALQRDKTTTRQILATLNIYNNLKHVKQSFSRLFVG